MPAQGDTLSTTTGTWTQSPSSFGYQWKRGGVAIGGATSGSYLIAAADVGTTLTVTVTATNAAGSVPATSAATATVTGAGVAAPDITINSSPLTNPPTFELDPGGALIDQHYIRIRHGADASLTTGVTVETKLFDEAFALGFEEGGVDWTTIGPGPLPGGNWSIQVQIVALDGTTVLASSAIRSATLVAAAASASFVSLRQERLNFGFGSGPATMSGAAIPILGGDKLYMQLVGDMNGGSLTGIIINGGAASFTMLGLLYASGNTNCWHGWVDTTGITSITSINVTVSGSTNTVDFNLFAVRGAVAGAPLSHASVPLSVTNEASHDVDGGLSADAAGRKVLVAVTSYAGTYVWTGATELFEAGTNPGFSGAVQSFGEGPNITLAGQAGGGPSYTFLFAGATKWTA